MKHTIRTTLLTPVVLLGLAATPAAATTEGAADPIGDSTNPYSDIRAVVGVYDTSGIALALTTDLSSSHDYWGSGDGIIFDLDVNGDTATDFKVFWTQYGASVRQHFVDGQVGPFLCDADTSFDGVADMYLVDFPASCIGTPASYRLRGYMTIFTGAYDFAPSHNTFSPWIYRDLPPPPPPPPSVPTPDPPVSVAAGPGGYWMATAAGGVYNFGPAPNLGGVPDTTADIESTPSGSGYWVLSITGKVLVKGDARHFGDAALFPGETATSMSAMPAGDGYWVFTTNGRVLNFGAAAHHGDMSAIALNGPVQDSVGSPSGQGYYLVASDGGIFTFGDAIYHGSMGSTLLNKPVVSMAPDPDGDGYWLVAADGGIFSFAAAYHGSMGGTPLNKPVTGMVTGSNGYMMVGEDGGIFSFGNVGFHGSLGSNPPASKVVAVTLRP